MGEKNANYSRDTATLKLCLQYSTAPEPQFDNVVFPGWGKREGEEGGGGKKSP